MATLTLLSAFEKDTLLGFHMCLLSVNLVGQNHPTVQFHKLTCYVRAPCLIRLNSPGGRTMSGT